jgi:hypothetical protein
MDFSKDGNNLIVRLDAGDEVISSLLSACKKTEIKSGFFYGIGALKTAELSHFSTKEMKYNSKTFDGAFEILSIKGNISLVENEPFVHAHVVLASDDFHAFGGHLKSGIVDPTCEIFIQRAETVLTRKNDGRTNLKLLDL